VPWQEADLTYPPYANLGNKIDIDLPRGLNLAIGSIATAARKGWDAL